MARIGLARFGMRGAAAIGLVIAGLAVPLACAGGDDSATDAVDAALPEQSVGQPPMDADSGAGGASERSAGPAQGTPASARPREIIRTADLSVVVDDVADAVREAERLATAQGGFLHAEEASTVGEERSSMTVKVPTDGFRPLLRELSALGEVESRRVASDDVTDQVVDLDARILSAQRSVERVRSFLDEANNVVELSSVEGELLRRETELEQLTAQRRTLGEQVSLATIRLSISTEPAVAPALDPLRKVPGFGGALADGVGALISAARVVGAGVGYALPFAIVLGVPLVAVRAVRRRRAEPAPVG